MALSEAQRITAVVLDAGEKSAAIDIRGARTLALQFPAAMEAVAVTFEVSQDGSTFVPLYAMATPATQTLVTLASPTASKAYTLGPDIIAPWDWIKIAAVVAADRTVLVALGD